MADRWADPRVLLAEGAALSWPQIAETIRPSDRDWENAKRAGSVLALRWHLASRLGLPAEPFTVWSRPARQPDRDANVSFVVPSSGTTHVGLAEPVVRAALAVSGGTVLGFGPGPAAVALLLDAATAPAGGGTVTLRGAALQRFAIVGGALNGMVVEPLSAAVADDEWKPFERVGVPYLQGEASYDAAHHGLLDAPTDPPTAAADRLRRAAPPMGWPAQIGSGRTAPPWEPVDPDGLVKEVRELLLPRMAKFLDGRLPTQQERFLATDVVRSPTVGTVTAPQPSTASFPTLEAALVAAELDLPVALALGLATGWPLRRDDERLPVFGRDLMVSARYDDVPDLGGGAEVATVLPWPPLPDTATVAPVAVDTVSTGPVAAARPGQPWTAKVSTSWDRVRPSISLDRPVAAAQGRFDPGVVDVVESLLDSHVTGGSMPLALTPLVDAPDRVGVADPALPLPTDATTSSVGHAVAQADAFGVWSQWQEVVTDLPAMPLPVPVPTAATAAATYAGAPTCSTTVGVDVIVDGTATSPGFVQVRGWLLPATWAGEPPPAGLTPASGVPPAGAVVVSATLRPVDSDGTFVPEPAGSVVLEELPEDGGNDPLPPPPAVPGRRRRWRLTFPAFGVDFVARAHWTLALWARETATTASWGAWGGPAVTSVSSPVPPVVTVVRPPVPPLASVPDADGRSHVEVPLPAVPGAATIRVWALAETTLLPAALDAPLGAPPPSLANRYAALRAAVDARGGARSSFTRFAEVSPGTAAVDVPLPRGSREIHLFAATAENAAHVESAWTTTAEAMWAAVAPLVVQPTTPVVTAVVQDSGDVDVTVEARSVLPVTEIALHGVRSWDAARDLGSMGPPLRTLVPVAVPEPAPHPLTGPPAGGPLYRASGTLPRAEVEGWKGLYLRAVANAAERDADRGMLGRSSSPSEVATVTVPPTAGPALGAAALDDWGAGGDGVVVRFTSAAPLAPTPFGPHTVLARAVEQGGAGAVSADVAATPVHLVAVDTARPAAGADAGAVLVRTGPRAAGGVPYALWFKRSTPSVPVAVTVAVTDPLGRSTVEQVAVPAGPLGTAVDLTVVGSTPGAVCLVDVTTSAPVELDPAGPWVLRVVARRFGLFPPPASGAFDLAQIPLVADLLPPLRPVEAARFPGDGPVHTFRIRIARPSPQRVSLALVAPDGTTATAVVNV